jgi:hypothetical protein
MKSAQRFSAIGLVAWLTVCTWAGYPAVAQTATAPIASVIASAPPHFVRFNGTAKDLNGSPVTGVAGVTFALYAEQNGGAPLWLETQNVQADGTGHYSVLLGATKPEGLPADLFASDEARWVGVQISGQPEQPRVLLVAVPYAMKAVDAETLGGRPASAYALAAPVTNSKAAETAAPDVQGKSSAPSSATTSAPAASSAALAGTGTTDYVPLWKSSTTLGNSLIFQSGTKIGINTTAPGASLAVRGNGLFNANSNTEALEVIQSGGTGSGIVATTNSTNGIGISGTSSSTASSTLGGIGVFGFSSNPSGSGVEGTSGNIGVTGNGGSIGGSTGTGLQGNGNQYGVYGSTNDSLFPAYQVGVYGTTASGSTTAYGVQGIATSTTGSPTGVYGLSSSTSGFGVEGVSGNIGVYGNAGASTIGVGVEGTSANVGVFGQGNAAGIEGAGTSGGYSGFFFGAPLFVGGNGNNALMGDPGCGSGYAGLGFTTGFLTGCTNYALLGGPNGGTYVNASGTASIHFRSNNNELATIDNSGNVNVIGQNGGGSLTVTGKVSSGNVIAQASASNLVEPSTCEGTLGAPNANCLVPNMKLTLTTSNPSVLVMASINGITTDQCALANFYLVVDSKIVALSSVSYNTNNSPVGYEQGSLTLMSLQNLAAGSHTFQVQQATDFSSSGCNTFTTATGVSSGDGGMGSQRSLIVREF